MAKKSASKKKAVEPKARAPKPAARRAAPKSRATAPKPAKKKSAAKHAPGAKAGSPGAARPAEAPRRAEPKRSSTRSTSRGAGRSDEKKPDREAQRARARSMRRFRQLLLAKYDVLVRAYNSSRGDTRRVTTDGTEDYIDYAVSSYDRDFSLSLSEMERSQMRMIEDALRRLDRGEYGDCLQCGEPIPEKRLEVEPWARHCVRCQALEEQGLLQQRPYDADYEEGEGAGEDEFVELEVAEEEEEEEEAEEEVEEEEAFVAPEGADEPAEGTGLPEEQGDDEDDDDRA